MNAIRRHSAFVIVFVGAFLLVPRIGEQHLWQDEAQTALLARTVVETGMPRAFSHGQSLSQEDGTEAGADGLWHWHPWLSFYVVAASFVVFGQTTAAARIPFVLFGIATIVWLFQFVRKHWKSEELAWLSALLLSTNVAFILLARQCRFYSMGVFFVAWALDAYLDCLDDRKPARWALLISLVSLLHTFHFFYAVLAVTLTLHALLYYRRSRAAFGVVFASAVINLPRMIWFHGFSFYSRNSPSSLRTFQLHYMYLRATGFVQSLLEHGLTYPLALMGFILLWRRFRKPMAQKNNPDREQIAVLLALLTAIQLLFAIVLAPASFIRYLAPLWIPSAIAGAWVVRQVLNWNKAFGLALLLVALLSRPLASYCSELLFGARGTVDTLVEFFQTEGKAHELVLTNYEDMPLKFYTSLQVMGGLTGQNLTAAQNADWIVLLQHAYTSSKRAAIVPQFVESHVDRTHYTQILFKASDSMLQSREDPEGHSFRTPQEPPYLRIFRRIH